MAYDKDEVASWLSYHRRGNVTQKWLAKELGWSQRKLSRIEHGNPREAMTKEEAVRIAAIFHTDPPAFAVGTPAAAATFTGAAKDTVGRRDDVSVLLPALTYEEFTYAVWMLAQDNRLTVSTDQEGYPWVTYRVSGTTAQQIADYCADYDLGGRLGEGRAYYEVHGPEVIRHLRIWLHKLPEGSRARRRIEAILAARQLKKEA